MNFIILQNKISESLFVYSRVLRSFWPEHDRCNSKKYQKDDGLPALVLEYLGVIPIISEASTKGKSATKMSAI